MERRVGEMMDCDKVKQLLSSYIDGELNEEEKIEFDNHIAKCSSCKEEFNDILKVLDILHSIPEVELPADFKEGLHKKLVEVKQQEIRPFRIRILSSVAAGIMVMFALGIVIFNAGGLRQKKFDTDGKTNSAMEQRAESAGNSSGIVRGFTTEFSDSTVPDTTEDINITAESPEPDQSMNIMAGDIKIQFTEGLKLEARHGETETDGQAVEEQTGTLSQELLYSENSKIKVSVIINDNAVSQERIIALVAENGGVVKDDTGNKVPTLMSTANFIEFTIPGNMYEVFLSSLKKDVEKSNANVDSTSPSIRDDIKARLEELAKTLEAINVKSKEIESRKTSEESASNPEDGKIENKELDAEMEQLESEKKKTEDEIEKLLESNEYVADVVINVSK